MRPLDPVTVARLVTDIVEADTEQSTVEQVVASAVAMLEVVGGGVTFLQGGGTPPVSIGASDHRVERADLLQHQLGEGPCLEASIASRIVWSVDLRHDERWPTWGPLAADLGLGSILSVEMHSKERRIGALNLYGAHAHEFGNDDRDLAQLLGRQASAAVLRLRTEHNLQEALTSRTLIGQAQGILMERFGVDADRAFQVLQRYSQDRNVKLRDVAERLVATYPAGDES
ncbi:GAF and ANTAR domain-containing protein [Aeromicrobium sp. Leaf350]|uniref:GAF and ANTAR domain-containing protein n=1 Tax=Aeromicrobium sp. Leaf350 TaxID=2876565 RepID=UPI001E4AD26F|nr:GAF and ANTAR domain-containing protein [Aeromicrobium sp. Leaf350]